MFCAYGHSLRPTLAVDTQPSKGSLRARFVCVRVDIDDLSHRVCDLTVPMAGRHTAKHQSSTLRSFSRSHVQLDRHWSDFDRVRAFIVRHSAQLLAAHVVETWLRTIVGLQSCDRSFKGH